MSKPFPDFASLNPGYSSLQVRCKFAAVPGNMSRPHPEEARSAVSKDGRKSLRVADPSRRALRALLRMRAEVADPSENRAVSNIQHVVIGELGALLDELESRLGLVAHQALDRSLGGFFVGLDH